ncbi:hypothetical protein F5880DRAFT_1568994 [Lentinula raphanica]|nr:hypothetical protein F5880DRAFT_1568994 [Lentinula raphanica]
MLVRMLEHMLCFITVCNPFIFCFSKGSHATRMLMTSRWRLLEFIPQSTTIPQILHALRSSPGAVCRSSLPSLYLELNITSTIPKHCTHCARARVRRVILPFPLYLELNTTSKTPHALRSFSGAAFYYSPPSPLMSYPLRAPTLKHDVLGGDSSARSILNVYDWKLLQGFYRCVVHGYRSCKKFR